MHLEKLPDPPRPEDVALALRDRPGLVWLDGQGSAEAARFSFVGSDPVEVHRAGWTDPAPLATLDRLDVPELPSGADVALAARIPLWIGFLAYDATFRGLGRARPSHARSTAIPIVSFGRYDALFAFDARAGEAFLVGDDADACARLLSRLESASRSELVAKVGPLASESPRDHVHAIERALDHIARGDIYQVNLARRFEAAYQGPPLALYRAMRAQSPVPYGFYREDEDHAVLGLTMELFLRWDRHRRELTTRPIKGTIARDETRDLPWAEESLRSDPKEHAEHAMIVDLMRNDLGRVAVPGTVSVARAFDVEPYAGLFHMVSTVCARPRDDLALRSLLEATFPPGSVTGTPKERAIEIIEALEPGPRGVYTGALGYVDRLGGVALAVAIRTAVVAESAVRYFAGGGIVEASDPTRELEETEIKAQVFRAALAEFSG